MFINARIAAAKTPTQSLSGLKFASVRSDLMPAYYASNDYMNGFWLSGFGGANLVDSKLGVLYGASLGLDRQFEDVFVGFYFSYALAQLDDRQFTQDSQNIQVGLYTSFNQRDTEVNFKLYGQTSITSPALTANANYVRQYAGLSASVGKVFEFNENSTFFKPFVGENYYYSYTPSYSGLTANQAQTINNHALSLELGFDFRQYFGANSFIYVTPKLERYVVNTGEIYTLYFAGYNTALSTIGRGAQKTYAQMLLGGNIGLGEKLNISLGLGARMVIAGHAKTPNGTNKDELYLGGNLGIKYRF